MIATILTACSSPAPQATESSTIKVFGAFATRIEEPWDGVIHTALLEAEAKGQIEYDWADDIGYQGDMERVLRETAETQKPNIIFGDAFGNEESVRRVAKDYPQIAFVFGSGVGPSEPNLSVFDNWIHEPAYLMGMLAGGLTESNKIGVVAAYPVPEVNRIVNAFTTGAKETNPDAEVTVKFINSWFDPDAAKSASQSLVDDNADVLFGERFGVIEIADQHGLWAFGNMSDQNALAADNVVSSAVWDMNPIVQYIIAQVKAGTYTAQDLKDFSMMAKGGAKLAPFHGLENELPTNLISAVNKREEEITSGLFRVDINEQPPVE
jgi:basic membrane lipoprotein Med (substrate-binding protein (PBP1-ABC) superfamily)